MDSERWLRCETGATWLDLIATVAKAYGPAPIERLTSADRLDAWFGAKGLRPAADASDADLSHARSVREALRGLALATVRGESWAAGDVEVVNAALADDRPLVLGAGGRLEGPRTPREALARIARQAAEHLTGSAARTLRTCGDPECGLLFLDPGGRRRWCSAEVCGVRHRVRVHRQRQGGGGGG
ncbi:CGNR zinc finger domain-containing protein [Saccharopolyspora taberi]|uniref:CGNR zinc finger domain-containing protein n=1 Tax=Saccharopolyspora taberi TaxID=60895 RepID=A0ABN3VBV6_9PSEU